jgi:hypothetical protein
LLSQIRAYENLQKLSLRYIMLCGTARGFEIQKNREEKNRDCFPLVFFTNGKNRG